MRHSIFFDEKHSSPLQNQNVISAYSASKQILLLALKSILII